MAAIRSSDTKPELLIRKSLHARGYRYRLHDRQLPGRPDIVLPKYNAAIFVHGCFWHGHDCHLFKWPKTRSEFWQSKIFANIERDEKNRKSLLNAGWRVAMVWECQMKGKRRQPLEVSLSQLTHFLQSDQQECSLGRHQTVSAP